jgi:hypothetical protein
MPLAPPRKRLVLSAAIAAALPLTIAIGLYLAVPAALRERVGGRLSPAGDAGVEAAGSTAAPAAATGCRERSHRVTIDGAEVDAFALLCREDASAGWTLVGPADLEDEAYAVEASEVIAAEAPEAAAVTTAMRQPPRRAGGRRSSRRADVAASRAPQRGHSAFYVDPRALSQEKFGL